MGKQKKAKEAMKRIKIKKSSKDANPFEMRINRQHHDILGRKIKKDKGMPGVSRGKAEKKRQETLLQEYRFRGKSNSFTDRRIGESDPLMDPEDRAVARFTRERKKKGSRFNLNEDEELLTHMGKSLGDIEKYDFPQSDDSEEEDQLGKEFVKKVHFGGLLTKKYSDGAEAARSQKELLDELIAESKQRKYERQTAKEENVNLTEKLDQDWKDLARIMMGGGEGGGVKNKDLQDNVVNLQSDYDVKVQELKFDIRGKATERLKTENEIAAEEMEKLQKLETERKNRMMGIKDDQDEDEGDEGKKKKKIKNHLSADALEDVFELEDEDEEEEETTQTRKTKKIPNVAVNEDEDDENDEEEEEEDEDTDDSYEDLLSEEDEEIELIEKQIEEKTQKETEKIDFNLKPNNIPFIIKCPETMEDFQLLIMNRGNEERAIIIERIMKCNHPSLAEGNKEKLESFFVILLQFLNDLCSFSGSSGSTRNQDITFLNTLIPHLHSLVQMSPKSTSLAILEVLKEKRDEFLTKIRSKKFKYFPNFESLVFFQLVSLFYSTSDFRHSVVTPAMIYMSEILTKTNLSRNSDFIRGLFICGVFAELIKLSKRLIPEVLIFINKVLRQFINLKHSKNTIKEGESNKINLTHLINPEISDLEFSDLKISILNGFFDLLLIYVDLYRGSRSYKELFEDTFNICQELPEFNCGSLSEKIRILQDKIADVPGRLLLTLEKRKPIGIKMYEPKIRENFDGRKERHGSQKKLEREKLLYKYKREMKGATRELRRDNQFIARRELNEQLEKDGERKRKLNLLYQDLAQQEGDFKKMSKKK